MPQKVIVATMARTRTGAYSAAIARPVQSRRPREAR